VKIGPRRVENSPVFGLNTVVPYGSGLYYQDRPSIGVPAKSVIPVDNMVGLNPNLQPLKTLYDQGKVAIIQGVGYANPDRSHFRSTQIWETADPIGDTGTGWLGRYLDTALADVQNPLKAVALGPIVPMTLQSERTPVTAIESDTSRRSIASGCVNCSTLAVPLRASQARSRRRRTLNRMLLIAKRDYLQTVRSKAYLVGWLCFPC